MSELTERELEVIRLITGGFSNKEIASAMGVTSFTIQFHITNISRKMGVSSKIEIAVRAVREGLA